MLGPESVLNERYRITFVVDEQADCRLYRARDEAAQRAVLIAELPALAGEQQGWLDQVATQLATSEHPALLRLHDRIAGDDGPLLVFHDPGGQELERLLLQRGGMLPESEALPQFDRLLGALQHLHRAGLHVGDLRATDIWTDLPGSMYLAPYAALRNGAPDDRLAHVDGDVYVFAGLLYQVLTGWKPPGLEERQAGVPINPPQELNNQISPAVAQVLMRALAVDPAQRYPSAAALRADLAAAQQAPAAVAPAPAAEQPAVLPAAPPPAPPPAVPSVAADPRLPQAPARENNTCLFALVAALALIALAICVVSLYLSWLLLNSGAIGAVLRAEPTPLRNGTIQVSLRQAATAPASQRAISLASSTTVTVTHEVATSIVGPVVFAPSNGLLALAVSGWIELRHSNDLNVIRRWQHSDTRISALAFAPAPAAGLLAASAVDETVVRLWDVASGRQLRELRGHTGWVRSLAFAPDGTRLAAGSTDTTIRLWDTQSGELLHTLEGHQEWPGDVAFAPDGRLLASSSWDGTVRLWDTTSGAQLDTFRFTMPQSPATGRPYLATGLAISPDGRQIAVGSSAALVYVLDAEDGRLLRTLEGHTDWIASQGLAFSPDGRLLASASLDGTLRLWSAETGAARAVLEGAGLQLGSLDWSADGRRIVAGSDFGGEVLIWETPSGRLVQSLKIGQGLITGLCYAPDSELFGSSGINGTIQLHPAAAATLTLAGAAASRESFVLLSDETLAAVTESGDVALIDLHSQQTPRILAAETGRVHSLAVSPDRQILAGGGRDSVTLWDRQSGTVLQTLDGMEGVAALLRFSPDGQYLYAASRPGPAMLVAWKLNDGRRQFLVNAHDTMITDMVVQPAGQMLVSAARDGTLRFWDSRNGRLLRHQQASADDGWISSLQFAPDNRLLVAGTLSGDILFWDAQNGELRRRLELRGGNILALAFRGDGEQIAVGKRDAGISLLGVAR